MFSGGGDPPKPALHSEGENDNDMTVKRESENDDLEADA